MFTYNVTFIVNPDKEAALLDYLKKEAFPFLFSYNSLAQNPELKKVIEAGGEKPDADHGLSIALSATFNTEDAAHSWNDNFLLPTLDKFHNRFGKHSLFFVTLLENLLIL